MEYVELLRARRILTWYGGILVALLAIGLALAFKDGPPAIQMSHDAHPQIPFWIVFGATSFAAVLLAAFAAVGLDAEHKTVAITWTRPLSRPAIALRYVAVDLGALAVAWLLTLAVVLIGIYAIGLGRYATFAEPDVRYLILIFGAGVMWYGLVLLVTSLLPGRGNAIAGASWAYALIVPGLSAIPFPSLVHQAVVALNYINPMAYIGNTGSGSKQLIAGSPDQHAAAAWLIGIAAIALATYVWSKREVPA